MDPDNLLFRTGGREAFRAVSFIARQTAAWIMTLFFAVISILLNFAPDFIRD